MVASMRRGQHGLLRIGAIEIFDGIRGRGLVYTIAICDDDEALVKLLRRQLEQYEKESGREFSYRIFYDGTELMDGYQADFDLIFMDIRMEKMNGLKAAEEIRKIDSSVGLVFLTSLAQYVWKGYEYGAVNYLLKPVKYGRLKMELDRFFACYRGKEEPFIAFSNDAGKHKVFYRSLRFAETCRHNVLLHFEEEEQVLYKNMKELSALLETERRFTRCHASYLVNLSFVKRVEGMEAVLLTGERLPISQPKRKEFMLKMTDFWGDML